MSASVYIFTIVVVLATIFMIFALKYSASKSQSAARIVEQSAYRDLAETAAAVQAEVRAELVQISSRLAAVEKILKEVG